MKPSLFLLIFFQSECGRRSLARFAAWFTIRRIAQYKERACF